MADAFATAEDMEAAAALALRDATAAITEAQTKVMEICQEFGGRAEASTAISDTLKNAILAKFLKDMEEQNCG